jgi:hypothetical protein
MPKIERKTQKIFAGAKTAAGNIARFGSLAAGIPQYADEDDSGLPDPDLIQTLPEGADPTEFGYDNGWAGAIVPDDSPALEDMNALFSLVTRQLAYLYQNGVPEWDAATTYYLGSLCSHEGELYTSLSANNTGKPVDDRTAWSKLGGEKLTEAEFDNLVGTEQLEPGKIYYITDTVPPQYRLPNGNGAYVNLSVELAGKEDAANKKQTVNPGSQSDYPSSSAVAGYVAERVAAALTTAFQREFVDIAGIGVEVPAGSTGPSFTGAEGDRCFTLSWAGSAWQMVCWVMQDGAWVEDTGFLPIPARDLHWVAVRNGGEIHGYYAIGVSDTQDSPPQWELIGADISDYYTKAEVDARLAGKADTDDVSLALATKADLVNGKVPANQLPALGIQEVIHDGTLAGKGTQANPLSVINSGGGGTSLKRRNVAVVDADGDDTTGRIGRLDLSFKTANAAFGAALQVGPEVYFDVSSINAECDFAVTAPDGTIYAFYRGGVLKSVNGRQWTVLETFSTQHAFRSQAQPNMIYLMATGTSASDSSDSRMFTFDLTTGLLTQESYVGDVGIYTRVTSIPMNESPVVVFANGNVMWVTNVLGGYWWVMRKLDGTFIEVAQMTSGDYGDGGEIRLYKNLEGHCTCWATKAATGSHRLMTQDGTLLITNAELGNNFAYIGHGTNNDQIYAFVSEYSNYVAILRKADYSFKWLATPAGVTEKYAVFLHGTAVFYIRNSDSRVLLHDWDSNTWKEGFTINGLAGGIANRSRMMQVTDNLYILQDNAGGMHVFDWNARALDTVETVVLQFGLGQWTINPAQVAGAPAQWPSRFHLTGIGPGSSQVDLSNFDYADIVARNGLVKLAYNNTGGSVAVGNAIFSELVAPSINIKDCRVDWLFLVSGGNASLSLCRVAWLNVTADSELLAVNGDFTGGADISVSGYYIKRLVSCRFNDSILIEQADSGVIEFMNCDFYQLPSVQASNDGYVTFKNCRGPSGFSSLPGTHTNSEDVY